MERQNIVVSIPRDSLKSSDFSLDENGDLVIDKKTINTIVKENINKIPTLEEKAISVTIGVSW